VRMMRIMTIIVFLKNGGEGAQGDLENNFL
jgi:hypothetical protein